MDRKNTDHTGKGKKKSQMSSTFRRMFSLLSCIRGDDFDNEEDHVNHHGDRKQKTNSKKPKNSFFSFGKFKKGKKEHGRKDDVVTEMELDTKLKSRRASFHQMPVNKRSSSPEPSTSRITTDLSESSIHKLPGPDVHLDWRLPNVPDLSTFSSDPEPRESTTTLPDTTDVPGFKKREKVKKHGEDTVILMNNANTVRRERSDQCLKPSKAHLLLFSVSLLVWIGFVFYVTYLSHYYISR